MTQPSPTPVPNHGTGWGLLLLFSYLYGIVAILGILTIVTVALRNINRRVPQPLQYLSVVVFLGAIGISLFTLLVAAAAQRYNIVGLLLLIVFLPLSYVVVRRKGTDVTRLAIITHAAMVWSIPFIVGFGALAFVGTLTGYISPAVTGVLGVIIVVAGTIILEHRWEFAVV